MLSLFLLFSSIIHLFSSQTIQLSSYPSLTLSYSFPKSDTIRFTLVSNTQGYVGIGFGTRMLGTNILLGYQQNGNYVVKDTTAYGTSVPVENSNQNVNTISGTRDSSKTTFVFERLLNTGNSQDYTIVPFNSIPLIWAYGYSDTLDTHQSYGRTNVVFQQCDSSCLTCSGSSSSSCSTCNSSYNLVNGYCVSSSIKCDTSCLTCSGTTASQCSSCDSNHVLSNGVCMISNNTNSTTTTNSTTSNSTNSDSKTDSTDTTENSTTSSNSTNSNTTNTTNNSSTTLSCDASCLTCVGSSNTCTSCSSITYLQNSQCLGCDSSCQSCNGGGATQCTSCGNSTLVLNNGACVPACPSNCLSCTGSICVNCNSGYTLTKNGQCFQANQVTSIKINDNPTIFLNYSFPYQNSIQMAMEFHVTGYISIGFGTSRMGSSDMVVAYMSNSQMILKSMTSYGHGTPFDQSTQNLYLISYVRDSSKTVVTFQRNMTLSRMLSSYSLSLNSDIPFIWAYGYSDDFYQHVNYGSQSVNFQQLVCDSSCLTCSGSSNNQCTSCVSPLTLQNGYCLQSSSNSSGSSSNSSSNSGTTIRGNDLVKDLTSMVTITSDFTIYYSFNSNNTITMAFRWRTGGYMSLGFGTTMSGIDVISAEYANNQWQVYDRWSDSKNTPNIDTDLGGNSDLTLLSSLNSDSEGFATVKFNRALNTGDRYDYTIQQGNVRFCFAYAGSQRMSYHGSNYYIFSFDFVEGFKGQATVEGSTDKLIAAHGYGLLIAWSFLADISLIIVRYFKNNENYVDYHANIFWLLDIFSLIVVFVVLGKNGSNLEVKFQTNSVITAHFSLGIIVVFLIVMQHLFGYLMKKAMRSKEMDSLTEKLPQMKYMHRYMGYLIYFISKATVLTGIWVYNDVRVFVGFIIYFGILFLVRTIIEAIYQHYYKGKILNISTSPAIFEKEFSDLIRDLEAHSTPIYKIKKKYPNLKWCMMNNSVYDLGKFDHPGGKFIIEQINGREIGRFFLGGYSLENTDLKPYTHSVSAKQILDQKHVAEINIDDINILHRIPTQKMSTLWKISEKTKLTQSITLFNFSSSAFLIRNYVKGVDWIGRHFTIRVIKSNNNKTRLYTTVISFTESNINLRKEVISFFEQKIGKFFMKASQREKKEIIIQKPELTDQALPLIIKKYSFPDALSEFIHHDKNSSFSFEIQGPHGPGLELTKNSNGDHIIFCGGTGILPFVDLLNYLLFKSIYHVLLIKIGKDAADKMNVYNEDYEGTFRSKFKLKLYASFQTKEEIEYLDFLFILYNINKEYSLGYFDMVLRINDGTVFPGIQTVKSHVDDSFFNSFVVPDQTSKIFICGNPKMNKLIPEICLRNQIERDKILVV